MAHAWHCCWHVALLSLSQRYCSSCHCQSSTAVLMSLWDCSHRSDWGTLPLKRLYCSLIILCLRKSRNSYYPLVRRYLSVIWHHTLEDILPCVLLILSERGSLFSFQVSFIIHPQALSTRVGWSCTSPDIYLRDFASNLNSISFHVFFFSLWEAYLVHMDHLEIMMTYSYMPVEM